MTRKFDEVDNSPILSFFEMLNLTNDLVRYFITYPKIQQLFNAENKFDLVISELALNEAILGKLN